MTFRVLAPWELPQEPVKLSCGVGTDGLNQKYNTGGKQLGKGGFGEVSIVTSKATGVEYACKSIKKSLDIVGIPSSKQQQHLDNIKREVLVLRKMRGTLNVATMEDVFEDDTHVHIVMELCRGGELLQRVGNRHYSERTVASYMRAVLRTLAQCHYHKILHRDIKPGNFMLLHDVEDSPVKAIDFGLAVFFNPKDLPMRNLGLEGTPHYMAPEMLSSEVYPVSDVWAAGVMAYYLLSGRFPFDDWKNPRNPALSQLWKAILTDEPKFSHPAWDDVSEGAKDFIRLLLTKDPKQRPSAQQALDHPWVQGKSKQRREGKPLAATIVQRLQKYSTENAFKRTVLDMITNELLQQHMRASLLQQQRQRRVTSSGSSSAAGPGAGAGTGAAGAGAAAAPTAVAGSQQQQGQPGQADAAQGAGGAKGEDEEGGADDAVLLRDIEDPQQRAMAARSLLNELSMKCQTVHASSAYSALKAAGRQTGNSMDMGQRSTTASGQPVVAEPAGSGVTQGTGRPGGGGVAGEGEAVDSLPPLPPRASQPAALTRGVSLGRGKEGSGHALQHYAFLMAAGERSVRKAIEGSRQPTSTGSGAGMMGTSPYGGGFLATRVSMDSAPRSSMDAPGTPGVPQVAAASPGSAQGPPSAGGALSAGGRASQQQQVVYGPGGSLHSNDDVIKLLTSVSRQRQEHRKMQRLLLDTSGHSQSIYANFARDSGKMDGAEAVGGGVGGLEPVREGGQAVRGASTSRRSSEAGDNEEASNGTGNDGNGSAKAGGSKEKNLLHKVGTALLKPVKNLMQRSGSGGDLSRGSLANTNPSAQDSMAPSGTQTPVPGGPPVGGPSLARQSALLAALAQDEPADLEENKAARRDLEEGGRGKGAYAALFGKARGEGAAAAALAAAAAAEGGEGVGEKGARSGTATPLLGAAAGAGPGAGLPPKPVVPVTTDVLPPTGAQDMLSIRTVKAHKQPQQQQQQQQEEAAKPQEEAAQENIIAAQLARIEQARKDAGGAAHAGGPQVDGSRAGPDPTARRLEGTVSKGMLYDVLGSLMGGPTQLAEFQMVMSQLKYDKNEELSYEQISEGLQYLGYRLEPSEVAVLMREVALGSDHSVPQSAFLASQVDWREFQANHRDEWLACLRKAFDGLGKDANGRIGADQICALLKDKLPEEEVNLAVQETLMDAAVLGTEGLDFDDFARLLRADSVSDLATLAGAGASSGGGAGGHGPWGAGAAGDDGGRALKRGASIELFDSRLYVDGSQHGASGGPVTPGTPGAAAGAAGGQAGAAPQGNTFQVMDPHLFYMQPHFVPALPTVPDDD